MMGKTTLHILMGRKWFQNSTSAQHISTTAKPKLRERGLVWVADAVGFCGSWVTACIYKCKFK